ncbi:hypothetical protein [Ectothiorhodospira shaposhnikovii]|uniref:hypothetical protein n=1 Tax=Ectothiorhodospira shaposhnikovii TaxID=1054 RepID=UPI001907AF59|nr:hypothetical protein [Ectothiorhodospira shaposhnikovii]
MNDDDLRALWPDGTMCELSEIEEMLSFMSDDYQVVRITRYAQSGEPLAWEDTRRYCSK